MRRLALGGAVLAAGIAFLVLRGGWRPAGGGPGEDPGPSPPAGGEPPAAAPSSRPRETARIVLAVEGEPGEGGQAVLLEQVELRSFLAALAVLAETGTLPPPQPSESWRGRLRPLPPVEGSMVWEDVPPREARCAGVLHPGLTSVYPKHELWRGRVETRDGWNLPAPSARAGEACPVSSPLCLAAGEEGLVRALFRRPGRLRIELEWLAGARPFGLTLRRFLAEGAESIQNLWVVERSLREPPDTEALDLVLKPGRYRLATHGSRRRGVVEVSTLEFELTDGEERTVRAGQGVGRHRCLLRLPSGLPGPLPFLFEIEEPWDQDPVEIPGTLPEGDTIEVAGLPGAQGFVSVKLPAGTRRLPIDLARETTCTFR